MGPAPAAGGRPARPRGPARPGPQPLRTTRERGGAGTPCGRRLGHPTDARDARVLVRADRDRLAVPQPAARSRRAARRRAPGRQRQKLRSAPRPSRPPPPLPCGSRAASPPPPPARRCPRPSGPPDRASRTGQGPPPPPRLRTGRGVALPAPPGIPRGLARGSWPWEAQTPSHTPAPALSSKRPTGVGRSREPAGIRTRCKIKNLERNPSPPPPHP